MKGIEIGIIGGTGGMGRWFARFFEKDGNTIHVSGRKSGMSAAEMARTCQMVIVSVPIRVTGTVINTVGPYMREDTLLMDLTSLKREAVAAMLESSVSEVIGCHPLFGPQVESMAGQNVVLCPARGNRWLPWLKGILGKNGASIVEATPEKHDRMMAIVQGLNHFNTIAMGMVLNKTGVDMSELLQFSTPNFRTKMEVLERVFCQNPGLYAEIVTMNPDARHLIDLYGKIITELKDVINRGDASQLAEIIGRQSLFHQCQ